MATLKQRLHKKNSSGGYDTVHLETSASLVLMSDGSTVETAVNNSIRKKFTGTIGTTWTEDADTGVKSQTVSISGITASMDLGVLDVINTHDKTSDGHAAFVEENNQFLEFITNGFAETVAGGITFYIYGDANTVNIPFGFEVT